MPALELSFAIESEWLFVYCCSPNSCFFVNHLHRLKISLPGIIDQSLPLPPSLQHLCKITKTSRPPWKITMDSLSLTSHSAGFGSTPQNSAFGAKPQQGGFGTTTTTSGGGLFGGGGTATAGSGGFGGFGTTQQSSGFGGSTTGGGLFGQAKPSTGFGPSPAPASNPFGSASTGTGFGGGFGTATPASTALGGPVGECQGTGSVPFQPYVEKEPNSTSNQQNSFQSIGFQQPYQKFSPEELRLADYTQGRRYGNQSNQPGAFGTNSNFGGFGNNNQTTNTGFSGANTGASGGLFGNSTSGFGGTSQPQNTGFGTNTATSGGLFGTKPPTSGGLFGSQTQTQPSGGLFGGSGSTGFGAPPATTGFGTTNTATGFSPFGAANNTAAKPAFSFGTTPASSGTEFGTTPAPTAFGTGGGGLFGGGSTGSGFGQPQQQQQQQPAAGANPFGGFGGNNQQQQAGSNLFGAKPSTTSLFGTQQQPPATGGGLFGAAQPAANSNPFGGTANTGTTNSLFGPKPPAAGGGLFGATQNTQTNNTGGGLFGGFSGQNQNQAQPQPNPSGGLFGNLGSNTQKSSSLFGTAPAQQQTGNNLFGNSGTQQGGGLFGSTNQQPQQQQQGGLGAFGGSLFGGPQQNQNQNQNQTVLQGTPQAFTTSINDPQAYGTSLFAQLGSVQNVSNPGPLATPLSSAKAKKTAALPMYKLNPASSSRFSTPAKRGFGFSYSNYGSPSSVSSAASTPGASFNNSLLGGSVTRGLSKSMSTSSLRRSFTTEDSILAPGAFSASPSSRHFGSTGSMKRLVINKNLRGDLFSPPQEKSQQPSQLPSTPTGRTGGRLTKRVSFGAPPTVGATNGALSPVKPSSTSEQPVNGNKSSRTSSQPEMEQVKNNELAIVPEEELAPPSRPVTFEDQEPGEYWMTPSKETLGKMARDQLERVGDFTVGRHGIGQVTFNREVNLTKINLDEVYDNLVILAIRSCTVYPVSAKKPPVGHGLNVPSTIRLLNSWPRSKDKRASVDKSGPRLRKHIDRLQKVPGTHFIDYDMEHGIWTFSVDHFTTYALDDDEEDEAEGEVEGVSEFGQSTLSAPPDTPTPKTRTPKPQNYDDSFASTQLSHTESDPEDTFQFRKKKILPGAFDDEDLYGDDEAMEETIEQEQESFLDERSVGSQSEDGIEEPMDQDDVYGNESVSIVDQEMAGSFPLTDNTAERDDYSQDDEEEEMEDLDQIPGGAMRARMRALKNNGTPKKFNAGNDWAATLQNTVSPKKQDRALLKSLIDIHGNDSRPDEEEPAPAPRNRVVSDGRGFATSIDLMNSLFGQTRSPKKVANVPAQSKGFEVGVPSCIN
jgi:nuclear pore complex protein Nup98-Nup96